MGSGENGAFTFLDILGILSFAIGLQNLELNIGQNDLAEQTQDIDERARDIVNNALSEIHDHLQKQDAKIAHLISLLEATNENH